MAGVVEAVGFGVGEQFDPAVEEVGVEDEIFQAPAEEHGEELELGEIFFDGGDGLERAVAGVERDILNEAMDGDAVSMPQGAQLFQ